MRSFLSRSLKGTARIVNAFALLGGLFWAYFAIGFHGVRSFCAEVSPGIPVDRLRSLAKSHNITLRAGAFVEKEQIWLIRVPVAVAVGEAGCAIRHNNVVVVSAAMEGLGP
jgi:hypothetical protein